MPLWLCVGQYRCGEGGSGVHGTPYAMTAIINGKSALLNSNAGDRFPQAGPIGHEGGMNLYAYCGNDRTTCSIFLRQ